MAELARLIGQTDALGNSGKGGPAQQPVHEPDQQDYYSEDDYAQPEPEPPPAPAGPPTWMQRANIRRDMLREPPKVVARDNPRALPPEPEPERDDYLSAVHPLHRYAQQPQVAPPQPGIPW